MLDPETTLFIGIFCGVAMGYPAGFFVARMIYRSPHWPKTAPIESPPSPA